MRYIYILMLFALGAGTMSFTLPVNNAGKKVTPLYEMSVADIDATQDISELSETQKINVMASITKNIGQIGNNVMFNIICGGWSNPDPTTGIQRRTCANGIVHYEETRQCGYCPPGGGDV